MRSSLFLIATIVMSLAIASSADAQVTHVTYYTPAVPVTTYYAPAVTSVPVTTYYAPTVAPAVPVTTFYAPAPAVTYQPVTVATTRYRPFLGGTVTRYRTAYSPVVVNPTPVVYEY